MGDGDAVERPTFVQRRALKGLAKLAKKRPGEPLSSKDWESYFEFTSQPSNRAMKRMLRALPSTPRCGFCGAPFSGVGGRLVRPLGDRPSRPGVPETITLKGNQEPFAAHRVRWFAPAS